MLIQYSQQKEHAWAFAASACFLGLGWAVHVLVAWFLSTGRGAPEVAWEVLIAATFMAPVVGTYRFIIGTERDESQTATLTAVLAYAAIKIGVDFRVYPGERPPGLGPSAERGWRRSRKLPQHRQLRRLIAGCRDADGGPQLYG